MARIGRDTRTGRRRSLRRSLQRRATLGQLRDVMVDEPVDLEPVPRRVAPKLVLDLGEECGPRGFGHSCELGFIRAPGHSEVDEGLRWRENSLVKLRLNIDVPEACSLEARFHPVRTPDRLHRVAPAVERDGRAQVCEPLRRGRGFVSLDRPQQCVIGRVREITPLAEDEPAGRLENPRDLYEAPVEAKRGDAKVAHDRVEPSTWVDRKSTRLNSSHGY